MTKKLQIRNSTAEFLTFASQNEGNSIEVRFEDNTLWLTQQLIAELFDTTKQNVSSHIQNIFADGEQVESSTCANFAHTADDGKTYQYKFCSLYAILKSYYYCPSPMGE